MHPNAKTSSGDLLLNPELWRGKYSMLVPASVAEPFAWCKWQWYETDRRALRGGLSIRYDCRIRFFILAYAINS